MLATGMIVGYGYLIETFIAWYSGNPFEKYHDARQNRPFGPYASRLLVMICLQLSVPQLLWVPAVRRNPCRALGDLDLRQRRACGWSGT